MNKQFLTASIILGASFQSFAADVPMDTVHCNPKGEVVVRSHKQASNPYQAYQGSWNSGGNNGGIRCTFTIPEDGTYKLWGRMIADDNIQPYDVDMDDDGAYEGVWSTVSGASNSFQWFDSGQTKFYSAGQHSLYLNLLDGEDNTRLDYLHLTSDMSYTPSGNGLPETQQYADYDFQSNAVSINGHLHASNGKLYNEHNQEIQLQGIGLHGLQWFPTRERNTIPHMVEEWGAELVRLAMYIEEFPSDLTTYPSNDYWGGWSSGPEQQQYMEDQVDRIVKEAVKAGIYVKITWHIHDDPTRWQTEAVDFFGRMSEKYGMLPNLILEPCNEPLGRDWSGQTSIRSFATAVINEIRARDPDGIDNMVIVGTPFYSANIQDVVTGDGLLDDPNVAYSLHHYAFSHDETAKINDALTVKSAGGLPWLSEWSPASYNITDIDLQQGADLVNKMNQNMFSSTVWSMSNKIETSSLLDGDAHLWGPWDWDDLSQVGKWFKDNSTFPSNQQYGYHFDAPVACTTNCITDNDNDGVIDQYWDNCLNTAAGAEVDENGCALTDTDGDGVSDGSDAFPNDPNEWADSDGDGTGDNSDAFPNDANETTDTDGDGYGDNSDAFPNDPSEWSDYDNDGIGDNADPLPESELLIEAEDYSNAHDSDSSNSGSATACTYNGLGVDVDDGGSNCNIGWTEVGEWLEYSVDLPEAGTYRVTFTHAGSSNTGSIEFRDGNDSVLTTTSLSPTGDWSQYSTTSDTLTLTSGVQTVKLYIAADGFNLDAFLLETDTDGDGVFGLSDLCGGTAAGATVDANGCDVATADSDGDGVVNSQDAFPNDPNESADSDGDGIGDNADQCDSTPSGVDIDANGCYVFIDDDGDLVPNYRDSCANTAAGATVDVDGCAVSSGGSHTETLEAETNNGTNADNQGAFVASMGDAKYVEWSVNLPSSGTYTVDVESSGWGSGDAVLKQDGVTAGNLGTLGGTNSWGSGFQTTSAQISLNSGSSTIRIEGTSGSNWELDSITLSIASSGNGESNDDDHDGVIDDDDLCPNSAVGELVDADGCSLAPDSDNDGVIDDDDNCANTPAGANVDANGCPTDSDNDGVYDGLDQCTNTPNGETADANGCSSSQIDSDSDGVMDNADQCANTPNGETADANGCSSSQVDTDGDGVYDNADNCANTPNGETADANGCSSSQIDSDSDGVMDNADQCANTPNGETADANGCSSSQTDTDGDGVMDNADNCTNTPNGETADANGCSSSQLDSDNDGVMDNADNCANTPNGESVDANGCSSSQLDDDNDSVMNNADNCANTPNGETADANGCSPSQLDTDNDGVMDDVDQCANTPNGETADAVGCSSSQQDADNDGVDNGSDNCANTPHGESVDANGCSASQLDDDNDGVMNNVDNCANTPNGESVDANGCSSSQLDDDNDGVMNNADSCANTPNGESVNASGCSSSQIDDDNDGVMNNADNCANTPNGESVDANGCSSSQLDDDNDGVMNNVDQCANTPNGDTVDADGCTVVEEGCNSSNSTDANSGAVNVAAGTCLSYNVQGGNLQIGSWNGSVVVSVVGSDQNVQINNAAGFTQFNTGTGTVYIKVESGTASPLQFGGW